MDLCCIVRMSDGRLTFEGESRWALLRAYCEGDETAAWALDERVQLQSHLAWKRQRLRRRVKNLLRPAASSRGRAGFYDAATGHYEARESGAIYLPD
jgi:hypothetical protein